MEKKLKGDSCNKGTVYSFVDLLYKIDYNFQLKIILQENNTVIIHKATFKTLINFADISVVYLSSCDDYKLVTRCHTIYKKCSALYVLNSPCCVKLLYTGLLHKDVVPNEIFIYDEIRGYPMSRIFIYDEICGYPMSSWIKLLSLQHKISAVLAVNNVMVGIHPSSEQIALALQLQPSPNTLILSAVDNSSVFYQVTDALAFLHTQWIKIDFAGCNIGDIECEILHRAFKYKNCLTFRKLSISLNKLSVSGIHDLVGIVLIGRIEKLDINGTNGALFDVFLYCLVKNLIHRHQSLFLFVEYNWKIFLIICSANWNEVTTKLNAPISELYIINCDLRSINIIRDLHDLCFLIRLCIINGSVSETVIINIIQSLLNKTVEVSISNIRIIDNDRMMRNLITSKEFYRDIKLSLVLSTEHWICICVYNVTKYRLKLIHQYFVNQTPLDCHGITIVTKLVQTSGNKMYMFENNLLKVVRLCAEVLLVIDATNIIAPLSNTTSVNTIEIDNYSVTNKVADILGDILQRETQLQEVCLTENDLQTDDAITITTALHNTVTLTMLSIYDNGITDGVAYHIATVISHNIHLQELNLGGNCLQASGAIKIARSLQKISSLTKLYINHNSITHEATDDIAAAISCNTKLE